MLLNVILLISGCLQVVGQDGIQLGMVKGKGSKLTIVCDPITASGDAQEEAIKEWGKTMYFCKEPCGWKDVYGGRYFVYFRERDICPTYYNND